MSEIAPVTILVNGIPFANVILNGWASWLDDSAIAPSQTIVARCRTAGPEIWSPVEPGRESIIDLSRIGIDWPGFPIGLINLSYDHALYCKPALIGEWLLVFAVALLGAVRTLAVGITTINAAGDKDLLEIWVAGGKRHVFATLEIAQDVA